MLNIFAIKMTTPRLIFLSYLIIIIIGAILLSLPISSIKPGPANFLTALFTSTSAVCVTGLIVVNTANYWSTFGQAVILILIQIGGLGIMAFSTMGFILLGKRLTLSKRKLLKEDIGAFNIGGIIDLLKYIITVTFIIELAGSVLLFLNFRAYMPDKKAVWSSLFHTVSAFNNAGFDIFGNSLENFTTDIGVNLTFIFLIILGGLGFTVIKELWESVNNYNSFIKFSLHSKIVFIITICLLLLGLLVVFTLERQNTETLESLTFPNKIMSSFFLSVTSRTAGFNTIPTGDLRSGTLFFLIFLMFIGASPCSTGGGIKTTTFAALITKVYSTLKEEKDYSLLKRRLKKETVDKATGILIISLLLIFVITLFLTIIEPYSFLEIFFETFSAFGTVGLSTGITGNLNSISQFFVIITMIAGRIGPLTLIISLGKSKFHSQNYRYPKEDIMIG